MRLFLKDALASGGRAFGRLHLAEPIVLAPGDRRDAFEAWLKPRFSGFITPKQPGDDAPIREDEETLVTEGA